jgi:hypothetical protein
LESTMVMPRSAVRQILYASSPNHIISPQDVPVGCSRSRCRHALDRPACRSRKAGAVHGGVEGVRPAREQPTAASWSDGSSPQQRTAWDQRPALPPDSQIWVAKKPRERLELNSCWHVCPLCVEVTRATIAGGLA